MQESENRVSITRSSILVSEGLPKVQEGSKEGGSLAVSTSSFKSNVASSAGEQLKESKAFCAMDLSNTKIHLLEDMDCKDCEARKWSLETKPMATSYLTLEVVGH